MADSVVEKGRKTGKSRRETAVQGTNDNSIVSKCSMASVGYFTDHYLQEFVCKLTRRAPLIHRGYYIRAKAIDYILKKFLQEHNGKKQILSLGAGFDSAYFRLKSQQLLHDVIFYEVDFPDVVKRKCHMIKTKQILKDLIFDLQTEKRNKDPLIEIDTADYKLLGVDLTQINTLEALLKVCDVDFDVPTLLLSECVLTYMTRRCSSAVVKWAAETFSNAVFVIYEQINPDDAFGLFMQNHFKVIGSPLKCINAFPTLKSQVDRCKKLGWTQCEAFDMNQFYNSFLTSKDRKFIEHLEPFDEYEEWHLKCAHYMILCAYNGVCCNMLHDVGMFSINLQTPVDVGTKYIVFQPLDLDSDNVIKRIGHDTVNLHDNGILVMVGGFGEQDGVHKRLTNISLLDLHSYKCINLSVSSEEDNNEIIRMHHTACHLRDGSLLLIGGRVSPIRTCSHIVKVQLIGLEEDITKLNHKHQDTTITMNEDQHIGDKHHSEKEFDEKFRNEKERGNSHEEENVNLVSKNEIVNNDEVSYLTDIGDKVLGHLCQFKSNLSPDERNNDIRQSEEKYQSHNCKDCKTDSKHSEHESKVRRKHLSGESKQCSEDNKQCWDANKQCIEENKQCWDENKQCFIKEKQNQTGNYKIVDSCDNDLSVRCSVIIQNGDVPSPRWRHSAVLFDKNGSECVFMYGGRTETDIVLKESYLLDVDSRQWTKICCSKDEPGERHSHAAVKWNDLIIVSGGLDADLIPVNSIFTVDTKTFEWKKLQTSGTLYERYSHTSHVIDNYLVLIGGVNLHHIPPGVAIINLSSCQAVEFPLPVQDKCNLIMLHRHTSTYIGDGKFVIVGGGGNCFSFGTHLNKTPIIMDISNCLKKAASSE